MPWGRPWQASDRLDEAALLPEDPEGLRGLAERPTAEATSQAASIHRPGGHRLGDVPGRGGAAPSARRAPRAAVRGFRGDGRAVAAGAWDERAGRRRHRQAPPAGAARADGHARAAAHPGPRAPDGARAAARLAGRPPGLSGKTARATAIRPAPNRLRPYPSDRAVWRPTTPRPNAPSAAAPSGAGTGPSPARPRAARSSPPPQARRRRPPRPARRHPRPHPAPRDHTHGEPAATERPPVARSARTRASSARCSRVRRPRRPDRRRCRCRGLVVPSLASDGGATMPDRRAR